LTNTETFTVVPFRREEPGLSDSAIQKGPNKSLDAEGAQNNGTENVVGIGMRNSMSANPSDAAEMRIRSLL
jgi:hypothetical protein